MLGQDRAPLSALLGQTLVALTREFEIAGASVLPAPSLVLWSNFLRFVGEAGVDAREVPKLARLSRRAMRTTVGGLERQGWVLLDPDASRKGTKILQLTAVGRAARDAWRPLLEEAHNRWRVRFGPDRSRALQGSLKALVSHLELELPHYPTGYGTADPKVTGGAVVAAKVGPPRIPAHGQDWVPVLRDAQDTVSSLPLSALLSQALVAFAIDYESAGVGSLPVVANVLRLIPDAGLSLGALPAGSGISGSGKSGLERHDIVVVEADNVDPATKRIRLTKKGRRMRESYGSLTVEIEQGWRARLGEGAVEDLRASLEAIANDLEPRLPHYPQVVWTGKSFSEVSRSV